MDKIKKLMVKTQKRYETSKNKKTKIISILKKKEQKRKVIR